MIDDCRLRLPRITCGRGTESSLWSGLDPRSEQLQKPQLSRPVRGVRPAKGEVQVKS